MDRPILEYDPEWEGVVEGWSVNYVNRHVWRTSPEYDFDDLMQECYLIFMMVVDRYPLVVEAPHFVSLYKRCVSNRIHDLSTRRSVRAEISGSFVGDGGVELDIESMPDTTDNLILVDWGILLSEVPQQVRGVMRLLGEEPPPRIAVGAARETRNQYLCRLAGVGEPVDLAGTIRTVLEGVA